MLCGQLERFMLRPYALTVTEYEAVFKIIIPIYSYMNIYFEQRSDIYLINFSNLSIVWTRIGEWRLLN